MRKVLTDLANWIYPDSRKYLSPQLGSYYHNGADLSGLIVATLCLRLKNALIFSIRSSYLLNMATTTYRLLVH